MTTLTFDVALFRAQFPEFADPAQYPDALLQGYWDIAICYISDEDYGCLTGACRQLALNQLVAHLARINKMIADGNGTDPGFVSSATIDKVSVTRMTPPQRDQWYWWLNQTPYGAQLLALLEANAVGGFYIGGGPELGAFRRAGGSYIPQT